MTVCRHSPRAADCEGTAPVAGCRSTLISLTLAIALCAQVAKRPRRAPILDYIKQTWHTLTHSHRDLAAAAVDPKYHPLPNGRWPVYVPRNSKLRDIEKQTSGFRPPARSDYQSTTEPSSDSLG